MEKNPEKTQIEIFNELTSINKRLTFLEKLTGTGFREILSLIDERKKIADFSNNDVEIERLDGPEDLLTPNDIFLLPGPMKQTAIELIRLRIATADDIAGKTKRERAVESGYLNQLTKMNYCRKIRISRNIFFFIGYNQDLEPIKLIKKDWREIIIMILRIIPVEMENLI